jgi:hypothetical protein
VVPFDTDAASWRALELEDRIRALSPAERARRVCELNAAVRAAALAGVQLSHPTEEATEAERRTYRAALLLGDDLVW